MRDLKDTPLQRADSIFYALTRSVCPECRTTIDAQVLLRDGRVYMRKRCPTHGWFEALLSSDAEAYVNSQKYNKPGDLPLKFSTEVKNGCPSDCGLCPEHKQHTCLALIEVNTACNLACPVCFADAGKGFNLTLEQVEGMLDRFVELEGRPEVVQFSGGEPTLHPQLPQMLEAARQRNIQYVMINTNGVRFAKDQKFLERIAPYRPFIYFQFDGLEPETYRKLRGEDLVGTKLKALDRLAEFDLDVILVAAVERGVNEHELGNITKFGLEHPAVRGVTFQPVTHVARHIPFDPMDRVTIPEVTDRLEKQTQGTFVRSDFIPVPCCFPTCSSITYAYVENGQVTPLPRVINVDDYLDYITNRAIPDVPMEARRALESLWSAAAVPGSEKTTEQFSCASCDLNLNLPYSELRKRIFMIRVKAFMDNYVMDLKQLMKCCVGVLTTDGRMIPFCAYNTLGYREQVRAELSAQRARGKHGIQPLA